MDTIEGHNDEDSQNMNIDDSNIEQLYGEIKSLKIQNESLRQLVDRLITAHHTKQPIEVKKVQTYPESKLLRD